MMNQNKKSEVRSRKQEARRKKPEKTESSLSSLLHLASCILLFALLIGCGISKDVYQKTAEESEARKASLEQAQKEVAHLKETYETLMKEMKEEIDKGEIKITQAVDRLSVNMVEKILFDSGKAEVKPGGLKILNRVGTILK